MHRVDASIGNTADFAHALANCEPVFAKAPAAISTGSEAEMDNFFNTCDYDITIEGLEDALKALPPGPLFDLRNAAGIYKFDQPFLAKTQMIVEAATGRICIDDQYVSNIFTVHTDWLNNRITVLVLFYLDMLALTVPWFLTTLQFYRKHRKG
jgi:hypothetical protein